jgi:hypothetical protein
MASRISSSDTATRSSTYPWTVATTRSLVVGDERPSAMLGLRASRSGFPAATESWTSRPDAHSTPTTCTLGRASLIAVAMPEIRVPPPTGTTTTSTSGSSSRISLPIEP